MKKILSILIALAACAALVACTAQESLSGSAYSRSSARKSHTVKLGTIVAIDEVLIEGDGGSAGSVGGGLLGAVTGSQFGGGSTRAITGVAGGIIGAVAGSQIEHKLTQRKGIEITVQLDNGDCMVVVQEPGQDAFAIGQRVRVLHGDGQDRVRPLN